MIQRIQSIYLLLAAISMAVSVFTPVFPCSQEGGCVLCSNPYAVSILFSLSALLAFVNIFLFKKRKLQITLCRMVVVMILLGYAVVSYYLFSAMGDFQLIIQSVSYGLILPIIALILTLLACRGIKKDEKKVRSLDRIR